MTEVADVVIAGGGVVGSAAAYYLRQHGFAGRIVIVEKDLSYAYGCTARSCGGVRQQFSTPENIALSRFGLKLIRDVKAQFGAEADVNFREQGYLILASGTGSAVLRENHAVQIANGADNMLLDAQALRERFPWLNSDGIALGCFGLSGEGWVDPWALMTLLRRASGVPVVEGEVQALERSGGRIGAVTLKGGRKIACGALVNAAGASAGDLARLAGIALPVAPRKRYVYVLDCPAADDTLRRGPLIVDPAGFYVRPEGRHFIAGLSPEEAEEPVEMDFEVDHGWFEERIWPPLAARIPAFEALKVINAWTGHYDYNALDQNAVLGAHPEISNFYFANGFSGHGLQQAPAAGNAIAELIAYGGYRTIDLTRLGYARIAAGAPLYERNVI